MMTILIADFDNTLSDALNGVTEAGAALGRMYRAALARAESAEAEAAEARATNEALAELAASETERRVALAERGAELEAERALLIADVCRVGKETCPYCGITLASGKCEECDWPRRYSLELETAAKVFAAPPPDAPTEPTP